MGADTSDTLVFLVVVGARFLVPLLIPRFPLPAIVACLVIDAADQTIFDRLTDIDLANYQSYDKALDIYYLTIAYLSVIRNWTNGFAVEVARFLWYYRLVGVVLFELLGDRWLLFVFPNTFEYYFIAYEAIRTGWDPRRLGKRTVIGIAAFIWIFIKLPQEWWIHIAQLDFTDFVKVTMFGMESDTPWLEAFGNRPLLALALAVAIAAIVVGVAYFWRRRPAQDWSLRFNVDTPVPVVELDEADHTVPQLRWPTFEKIALITLVSIIFSQMLGIGASNLQLLSATALVVGVNAGLSVWLARRGTGWRSLGVEFVTLAAINATLLGIFANVVADGQVNRAATLFFGLLLTLIIVMFDRFRAVRQVRLGPLRPRGRAAPT